MQIQKTIKFKVGELSNSKRERLDLVLNKSLLCLKDIIQIAIIENTSSNKKLHHLCYDIMRKKYKLPACVIHQCRNKAVEMLKSWNRLQRRNLKKQILPPNPKASRIRYDNVVFNILKTESKKFEYFVSFLISSGYKKDKSRIYLPLIVNSDYQKEYIKDLVNKKYKLCASDLVKKNKDYFIHITFSKEINIPKVNSSFQPIGIDIGINNLAVVSVAQQKNPVKFFSGKRLIWKLKQTQKKNAEFQKNCNLRLQRKLNQELVDYRDFLNHQISSYVIKRALELERPVIVLENLRYIQQTTKHRKKYKNIFFNWSFKKLQEQILYKANWEGIPVLFIEPNYTSQICPKCFSTNKRKKHNYKCSHCGYSANSDFVGAVNIRKKFFEFIQFEEQASINYALNITCSEPKALKIRSVQNSIKLEDVSPSKPKGMGIRNIEIL